MTSVVRKSSVVIGLDIGTTSVSAAAIAEDGSLVKSVTINHEAGVSGLPRDCAEQRPEALRRSSMTALKQVVQRISGDFIAGIGLTGQMHSTLLLDRQLQPLGNVITWQDRRALRSTNGGTLLQQLRSAASEEATHRTGCQLSPGYLGTTLYCLKRLQQWPGNAAKVTFVADWISSCLSDQAPLTDRSHAASSGLFDLVEDRWSPQLLTAAQVDEWLLPEVQDSGVVIGSISRSIAEAIGIPQGTPVCNSVGDNQASVLSCLSNRSDQLLINIGTGGQIVWRCQEFQRLPGLDTRYLPPDRCLSTRASQDLQHENADGRRHLPAETPGTLMMVGAGLCGGDALAWVNRTIQNWLADFGFEMSSEEIWNRLNIRLRESPPVAADDNVTEPELLTHSELICEPYFRGTRQNPERRGRFEGVSNDNFTPTGVAHSVLNGIARSMFDVYVQSGKQRESPARHVCLSGNGARRNPLLVEAVTRIFQLPVAVAPIAEEAAVGAAFLAGSRLGVWESIQHVRELNSLNRTE